MMCDECKTNEAVYTVSVMVGDTMTTRHLCAECMARMNAGLTSGNIRSLLSSILSAITGGTSEETPEEPEDDVVCPRCGTHQSRFIKSGRLGCPTCYETFREQLHPMLLQIHGRVQHAGRRPLASEDAQRSRSLQETLTRQLEQAVALEDFETAAALRDRIRSIAAAGEEQV